MNKQGSTINFIFGMIVLFVLATAMIAGAQACEHALQNHGYSLYPQQRNQAIRDSKETTTEISDCKSTSCTATAGDRRLITRGIVPVTSTRVVIAD